MKRKDITKRETLGSGWKEKKLSLPCLWSLCAPQRLCVWPCREESIAIPEGQKGVIFMFFFEQRSSGAPRPQTPDLFFITLSLYFLIIHIPSPRGRRSERGPQGPMQQTLLTDDCPNPKKVRKRGGVGGQLSVGKQ